MPNLKASIIASNNSGLKGSGYQKGFKRKKKQD